MTRSKALGEQYWRGRLTPMQATCVQLMALGKRNPEIGVELNLTVDSVKGHLFGAYKAVGAQNRVLMARWWWIEVELPLRREYAQRQRAAQDQAQEQEQVAA